MSTTIAEHDHRPVRRHVSVVYTVKPMAPSVGGFLWVVWGRVRGNKHRFPMGSGWAATESIAKEDADRESVRLHDDACDCGQAEPEQYPSEKEH